MQLENHPCWKSVERLFTDVEFEEMHCGLMYMSSGTADHRQLNIFVAPEDH